MTILHISDTHGFHKQLGRLPITDIIVHTGDFTSDGTDSEASDFIQWFCRLPHKHKVFIAGNHDMCMFGKDGIKGLPENVHYLCNSSMEIEGIKFYGMPMFMENMMGGVYDMLINAIPDDVNVLLTHQPPYGILDEGEYHDQQDYHYGNSHLFAKILDVKPTLHFFGHNHNVYGRTERFGITFSNATIVDEHYDVKEEKYLMYKI